MGIRNFSALYKGQKVARSPFHVLFSYSPHPLTPKTSDQNFEVDVLFEIVEKSYKHPSRDDPSPWGQGLCSNFEGRLDRVSNRFRFDMERGGEGQKGRIKGNKFLKKMLF